MGEFELIRRHFQRPLPAGSSAVVLGIGDDCALLQPSPGHQLAISSDMLVEGRHFFADVDPEALGHKALAVNLSDLAAMGARPLGFTLALALPQADNDWLAGLARGLFALADAHACPLVGGDTTRGPLNLCVTVFGEVAPGQALRRDAARAGDDVYLSGRTGEARLALEHLRGTGWALAATGAAGLNAELRARLERPTPRNALGRALAGAGAHAAIDLSDGLVGDLGHILLASGVGAEMRVHDMPLAPALRELPLAQRLECLLAGGDDYELLFTAPPDARARIEAASVRSATPVARVGHITAAPGLRWLDADGRDMPLAARSFDHFA
ncbi:MAG: thiamine-phosphate kinase [Hydrogenophaga sp.]|jgi:thiamine-monophosphate kinase|uniref:thiamine-phosphate kinase n=1 Tax=Hydrogenophaga sp. TaxID=1904254 RepID=UPI001D58F034|nr:thiamine-phosphate kinase [Hydrogenophaga sp.]MBW0170101.1 thiamine-phosphate kinase [Hydrogenophaga sp.]MBW0182425.1 thiamine-phosphate kinase [Hydrogenophaga sp.]